MNAKDLLGKKIIDKNARDLAKLAEIDIDIKTFTVSNIYGSIGNPLNKKYYDIPADTILAIGDYIQLSNTSEELESKLLDKIPESQDKIIKINNLIGKTVLDCEGNVAGKVTNIDLDFNKYDIIGFEVSGVSSSFGKSKKQNIITKEDIAGIGDYIIINKVFVEETEEPEKETEKSESDNSVKIDIE